MGEVGGRLTCTPLERGAAAIMSLVRADGLLTLPRMSEGLEAGSSVKVKLLRPLDDICKKLCIVGSHDMILDIAADRMPISSAHVGSTGGLFALQRKECHVAPIHLLDAETGEYNIPFIKKFFEGKKMVLVKGVGRTQGFMILKGNPKGVKGIEDVVEKRLMFANRQRGAGTRLLLDYILKNRNLSSRDIIGYDKEYSTHLAVASAVKNGNADTGLGVLSAAQAMGLDFVPLGTEEYDFLADAETLNDLRMQEFLSVIKSDGFKRSLEALGGYTYDKIGEIIEIE
jgi:putative molybdopterin biosynthesis protein